METQELRLECLKLAKSAVLDIDGILATAERYFQFVQEQEKPAVKESNPVKVSPKPSK